MGYRFIKLQARRYPDCKRGVYHFGGEDCLHRRVRCMPTGRVRFRLRLAYLRTIASDWADPPTVPFLLSGYPTHRPTSGSRQWIFLTMLPLATICLRRSICQLLPNPKTRRPCKRCTRANCQPPAFACRVSSRCAVEDSGSQPHTLDWVFRYGPRATCG